MNEEVIDDVVAEGFETPAVAEGFETTPDPTEKPEPEEEETPSETETEGEGEGEEPAVQTAAYNPNHKFKAMGQEKEFDPWAKKLIKDPDTEKSVRELYEKAHGLEPVKQKLHRTREQLSEVSGQHQKVSGFIEESIAYRDAGDFGKLFESWKIDPVQVAKWLSQEIEMNDPNTPPHVKDAYSRSVEATRRNISLERENRSLESSHSEVATQNLAAELHAVMSQPDVTSVQQSVDSRSGKPGTFYNMVVRHAIAAEARDGRQLSADEAVKEVVEEMGYFLKATPAPGNPAIPKTAAPAQTTPPATLPKAPGTGTSPTKKGLRSTEDLRKLYNQKYKQEAA